MLGFSMYEEYLLDILKGYRLYDVRLHPTNKRGRIALIKSKTNLVYGFVDFVDVKQISYEEYVYWYIGENYSKEEALEDIAYNNTLRNKKLKRAYAYIFKNPVLLDIPLKVTINKKDGSWIEFDEGSIKKGYEQLKLF